MRDCTRRMMKMMTITGGAESRIQNSGGPDRMVRAGRAEQQIGRRCRAEYQRERLRRGAHMHAGALEAVCLFLRHVVLLVKMEKTSAKRKKRAVMK